MDVRSESASAELNAGREAKLGARCAQTRSFVNTSGESLFNLSSHDGVDRATVTSWTEMLRTIGTDDVPQRLFQSWFVPIFEARQSSG